MAGGIYTTEQGAFRFVRMQPDGRGAGQVRQAPKWPLSPPWESHLRDKLIHGPRPLALCLPTLPCSFQRAYPGRANNANGQCTNDVTGEGHCRIIATAEVAEYGHATPISSTRPAPHMADRDAIRQTCVIAAKSLNQFETQWGFKRHVSGMAEQLATDLGSPSARFGALDMENSPACIHSARAADSSCGTYRYAL